MFCPNCGAQNPDGAQFCSNCGATLGAQQYQQPQSQPQYQQPQQQYQSPQYQPQVQQPYAAQPKKNRSGLIALIAGAAVVAVVALFVWPGVLRDKDAAEVEPNSAASASERDRAEDSGLSRTGDKGAAQLTSPVQPETQSEPTPPETQPVETQPVETQPMETQPVETQPVETQPVTVDPQPNEPDTRSDDPNALSDQEKRDLAALYSTTDNAAALDFDWFLDLLLLNGEYYQAELDAGYALNDPLLLEGGWKAYLRGNGEMDNDVERYLNAEIHTVGSTGKVTLNWWYVFFPSEGSSFEETGSSTFTGTWDGATLCAASSSGNLELTRFGTFGSTQYAIGTFLWPSGEADHLALMRP